MQGTETGLERNRVERTIALNSILDSFHSFSPAGFLQLNSGIRDFAAVYLFVLLSDIRPGSQPQRDVVTRTQTRVGRQYIVTHAPEIDE